jgi:hypothetical protein
MDADEAFTVHGNPLTDDDALVCPTTDPQATYAIIQDAILDLWDIVNGLSLVTPPKRSRYSVTIFGSARLPQDSSTYAAVQQLATDLTRMGCDIITGGGSGAMEAPMLGASWPTQRTLPAPLAFESRSILSSRPTLLWNKPFNIAPFFPDCTTLC